MALARDVLKSSKLSNVFDFANLSNAGNLKNACCSISVRTAKHYNPKFRWCRSKKYIDVKLPHTEEAKNQRKDTFKNLGIFPRYWKPRPLTIISLNDVIDPYVPEVGDGKVSVLSKGVSSLASASKNKLHNSTAIRKIKNFDTDFKKELFVQEAHDIYVKAHTVLMDKDSEALSKYVTEVANAKMLDGIKGKTIKWKFLESLEPPVVVHARAQEAITKNNIFAQLTVRFHTKQTLAIYDRFGRLMYGSEIIPKDVLEYVVFEKHLSNEYGIWRLHAKIIPEWSEHGAPYTRTYRVEEIVEDDEDVFIDEEDPEPDPDLHTEHTATSEIVQPEAKTSS